MLQYIFADAVFGHILQVSIFAGLMSFALLRFVFSLVLAFLVIISGSRLLLCLICCLLTFFLLALQCIFVNTAFGPIFTGADVCRFDEFCVAAVRFFACSGIHDYFFGLATSALSALLLACIFFCLYCNAYLQILCLAQFLQVLIFAGLTSFLLLRFVFSLVCACLGIISGLRLLLCLLRCYLICFYLHCNAYLMILCLA